MRVFIARLRRRNFQRQSGSQPTNAEQDARAMEYMTSEEILEHYLVLCRPHGKVEGIRLFCHRRNHHEALCMIEMGNGAGRAAAAVGGSVFGTTVCVNQPLPAGFRCRSRMGEQLLAGSCDECHWTVVAD